MALALHYDAHRKRKEKKKFIPSNILQPYPEAPGWWLLSSWNIFLTFSMTT